MRVALFISIALLTGWITTSSLDTQKRLKKLEAQQTTSLEKMDASLDNIVKLAKLINDTNFEAQQAKAFASNNNQQIRKLAPVIDNINAAAADNLTQMQRVTSSLQDAKDRSTSPPILAPSTPRTVPPSPPPFIPSRKIEVGRDLEKERELRALEGIESALEFQNNYR
jgi:hypothetical protein